MTKANKGRARKTTIIGVTPQERELDEDEFGLFNQVENVVGTAQSRAFCKSAWRPLDHEFMLLLRLLRRSSTRNPRLWWKTPSLPSSA